MKKPTFNMTRVLAAAVRRVQAGNGGRKPRLLEHYRLSMVSWDAAFATIPTPWASAVDDVTRGVADPVIFVCERAVTARGGMPPLCWNTLRCSAFWQVPR